MMQLLQEHKSLWRIINDYREDAEETGDEELTGFWEELATQKAEQVANLQSLVDARMAEEAAKNESES